MAILQQQLAVALHDLDSLHSSFDQPAALLAARSASTAAALQALDQPPADAEAPKNNSAHRLASLEVNFLLQPAASGAVPSTFSTIAPLSSRLPSVPLEADAAEADGGEPPLVDCLSPALPPSARRLARTNSNDLAEVAADALLAMATGMSHADDEPAGSEPADGADGFSIASDDSSDADIEAAILAAKQASAELDWAMGLGFSDAGYSAGGEMLPDYPLVGAAPKATTPPSEARTVMKQKIKRLQVRLFCYISWGFVLVLDQNVALGMNSNLPSTCHHCMAPMHVVSAACGLNPFITEPYIMLHFTIHRTRWTRCSARLWRPTAPCWRALPSSVTWRPFWTRRTSRPACCSRSCLS